MKTALESRLHPHVSQEALRSEYERFRRLMPNYNEWLQYMHDQRSGKLDEWGDPIGAHHKFSQAAHAFAMLVANAIGVNWVVAKLAKLLAKND